MIPAWYHGMLFAGIPLLIAAAFTRRSATWFDHLEIAFYVSCLFALIYLLIIPIRVLVDFPFWDTTQKKAQDEAAKAFVAFIGKQPQYIDIEAVFEVGGFLGSGLAVDNGIVYLMEGGNAISVPWEKVRSWSSNIAGYEQIINTTNPLIPGQVAEGMIINKTNTKARVEAINNSGFFVEIASIETPSWQFRTQDEKLLKKWYEIFNQLNENGGKLDGEQ